MFSLVQSNVKGLLTKTPSDTAEPKKEPERQDENKEAENPEEDLEKDGSKAQQDFDELYSTPIYKKDEFAELLRRKKQERGTTALEKRHWSHPRRWKAVLWDIKMENCFSDNTIDAFAEFDVGGDREEVRVEAGKKTKVFATGELKNRLRTTVAYGCTGGEPAIGLDYRATFEYRGSYLDVEYEKMKIRIWSYNRFRLNHLEAFHEEPLLSYISGPIYREHDLYKPVGGKRSLRFRISFHLFFQEVYDFELSFFQWRVFGYQTSRELNHRIQLQRQSSTGATNDMTERLRRALTRTERQPEDNAPSKPNQLPKGQDSSLSECEPKLSLTIINKTNKSLILHSTILYDEVRPIWDNIGTLYFRGTIYELESAILFVEVQDMLGDRSKCVVAKGTIPLKGVVDYAYLRTELRPPTWLSALAKVELREQFLSNILFGSLEGKVAIANTPRHRQTGELGSIDKNRVNLFVQILKIDAVITAENRKDVNTFVQVSFDGDSKMTRCIKNTLAPSFGEVLVVPLMLPDRVEVTRKLIEQKGLIWIDVWDRGTVCNEHCGGASISLHEIFFDGKNNPRHAVNVKITDNESGDELRYLTRKFEEKLPLSYIFTTDRSAQISVAIWTMPDLLEHYNIQNLNNQEDSPLPDLLAKKIPEYKKLFDEICQVEATKCEEGTRFYFCSALDQRLGERFLPTLCGKVVPPKNVDSCSAVSHYVRCVTFTPPKKTIEAVAKYKTQKAERLKPSQLDPSRIFATPEFTLTGRSGSIVDHALLHVSLLIGLNIQAFVCVGTLWNKVQHIWVCTFHFNNEKSYGYVKLWDTSNGQVYILKNRFKDRQIIKNVFVRLERGRASTMKVVRHGKKRGSVFGAFGGRENKNEPKEVEAFEAEFQLDEEIGDEEGKPLIAAPRLPYRTIDMMFNHLNIWVNKQDPNPTKIWFDIWRSAFWHQFSADNYDVRPCFMPRAFGTVATSTIAITLKLDIRDRCYFEIPSFRGSRNLSTRWNKDPDLEKFLEKGLELLHQAETAGEDDLLLAEVKHRDWKKALYSKTPKSWRLRGCPMHFNKPDPKMIADALVQKCDFIECRERSATFALAVYVNPLPGELFSVYALVIMVVKLAEREKRRLREKIEKERREKALKRLQRRRRRKRCGSNVVDSLLPESADIGSGTMEAPEEEKAIDSLELQGGRSGVFLQPGSRELTALEEQEEEGEEQRVELQQEELLKKKSVLIPQLAKEISSKEQKLEEQLLEFTAVKRKARKIKIPSGSVRAAIILPEAPMSGKYLNPSLFKEMMQDIEDHIAEGLRIPSSRIRAYECIYKEGKIMIAVTPPSKKSPETPEELVKELTASILDIIDESPKLFKIFGGEARIECVEDSLEQDNLAGDLDSLAFSQSSTSKKKKKKKKKKGQSDKTKVKKNRKKEADERSSENEDESPKQTKKEGLSELKPKKKKKEKILPLAADVPSQRQSDASSSEGTTATATPDHSLDDAARRESFYKEMQELAPEVFNYLYEYYLKQGHVEDNAKYFAGYYTALKVHKGSGTLQTETE